MLTDDPGLSSVAFIDEITVTVALPAVHDSLQATALGAQGVIEAYTLLLAALVLFGACWETIRGDCACSPRSSPTSRSFGLPEQRG